MYLEKCISFLAWPALPGEADLEQETGVRAPPGGTKILPAPSGLKGLVSLDHRLAPPGKAAWLPLQPAWEMVLLRCHFFGQVVIVAGGTLVHAAVWLKDGQETLHGLARVERRHVCMERPEFCRPGSLLDGFCRNDGPPAHSALCHGHAGSRHAVKVPY